MRRLISHCPSRLFLPWAIFIIPCFFSYISVTFTASSSVIDPAEQLEREEHQKRVQEELLHIPEKVRLPAEQGIRFQPFKGSILIKKINITGNKLLKNLLSKNQKGYIAAYSNRYVSSLELNELILKLNTILFDQGLKCPPLSRQFFLFFKKQSCCRFFLNNN